MERKKRPSHNHMMAGAKIFACNQLCSQQIWKHGQTADKSIWTETPWVQLWKATKRTKHHLLILQFAERHSCCSTQRKAVELLFRRVLQLTYALNLVPIFVKLIFAIGALLPLQQVDVREKTFLAFKSSNSARAVSQQASCEHEPRHLQVTAAYQQTGHREVTEQLFKTLSHSPFIHYQLEHPCTKDISEQSRDG